MTNLYEVLARNEWLETIESAWYRPAKLSYFLCMIKKIHFPKLICKYCSWTHQAHHCSFPVGTMIYISCRTNGSEEPWKEIITLSVCSLCMCRALYLCNLPSFLPFPLLHHHHIAPSPSPPLPSPPRDSVQSYPTTTVVCCLQKEVSL